MVLRPAAAFSYILKAFVAVLKMNMEISPVFKHLEYDIPVLRNVTGICVIQLRKVSFELIRQKSASPFELP